MKDVLEWIEKKRKECRAASKLVSIDELSDWVYQNGEIRHKKGKKYFFSVQGLKTENWDQPIIVQKEGGIFCILCQKQAGVIKYLLAARYEPGLINLIQLAPTIQSTWSNLRQGVKFSEFLNHKKAKVIYKVKHSEEGTRFWHKENLNMLIELDKNLKLPKDNDFIWLTLPQIKKLMLIDNLINPYVRTVLAPL
jgi:dTDP-4-dehydro-6-deoxy-alpha-D-glucopyranose 2,3-dehydratase